MARNKKGRSQLAGSKKKAGTMMIVGTGQSNNDGVLGPVERAANKKPLTVRKKGNSTASKKLNSAVTKKQAKRHEKFALLQLTQAFAANVAVADNVGIHANSRIVGGAGSDRGAEDNEFAREQASLRDRMHAKKTSMVVSNAKRLSSSARKGTRGNKNGGTGGAKVVKVMFDDSTITTDRGGGSNKNKNNRSSTTTALQFAPPSFSLTKSTRQLLEETVLGLNGFGVSEKTTSSTAPYYSGSTSFPASSSAAWSIIPRPPPNTPIVRKNPFARLNQEDDDNAAVVPGLTFQPARFEPAVGTMMDNDVDPDL
jgi:hypothetical protein